MASSSDDMSVPQALAVLRDGSFGRDASPAAPKSGPTAAASASVQQQQVSAGASGLPSHYWAPPEINGAGGGLSRPSIGLPPGPHAPPSTFKVDPRTRHIKSSEGQSRPLPLTVQGPQKPNHSKVQLPPIRTLSAAVSTSQQQLAPSLDYQSTHHSLIPKRRGPSAYVKRHHASHGMGLSGPLAPGGGAGSMALTVHGGGAENGTEDGMALVVDPTVRRAVLKALAMNSEMRPGRAKDLATETLQSQWKNTSIGDLEALDSILDQLVVVDDKMREALLLGPPISFETVFPPPSTSHHHQNLLDGAEEDPDKTFMTSVGMEGTTGVEMPGEGDDQGEAATTLAAVPLIPVPQAPQQAPAGPPVSTTPRAIEMGATSSTVVGMVAGPAERDEDLELARERIPVPILPKMARMYITTRQSNQVKAAPPLPPPTADYLLRSRPPPSIAAPSYDELCDQIRGVQRQYTCGTVKADRNTSPSRTSNNMDMYISGIDGPALDQMILYEEAIGMDRTRPTFVAMKKGTAKLKIERQGSGGGPGSSSGHLTLPGPPARLSGGDPSLSNASHQASYHTAVPFEVMASGTGRGGDETP